MFYAAILKSTLTQQFESVDKTIKTKYPQVLNIDDQWRRLGAGLGGLLHNHRPTSRPTSLPIDPTIPPKEWAGAINPAATFTFISLTIMLPDSFIVPENLN